MLTFEAAGYSYNLYPLWHTDEDGDAFYGAKLNPTSFFKPWASQPVS